MENEVLKYLKKDKQSFAYWGRAGYFWKHFKHMDLDKVYEFKHKLLKKKEKTNE